ncbi:MAG: ABC transporter permease, partial [Lachnospiraceae bacterium]|nr:ABC transporter permease [Lachnospiraceae bacterium]
MPVFKATMKSLKVVLLNISIYFVIFIVFGDMTAWGSSSSTETIFEETKLDVVIIDNDNSALSRGLTEYIDKTQDLKKAKTDDLRVINDNIRFNIYDYAIIIPSGFEEKVKNGEFKDAIEYIS